MKKLIRNAAYAAAGLLAVSCSNDIPDNVTPVNRQDTGDGMYITLNLGTGTNGTRADNADLGKGEDENASAAEAKINSIKIYLYNNAGLMLPIEFGSDMRFDAATFASKEEGFYQADDAEGPAETQVKIKVVKGTFDDIKALAGGSLNYFIACNYDTSLKNKTLDEIKAIDNIASRDDHNADFVMTATGNITIADYNTTTNPGLKADDPWNIVAANEDIYVTHIEARCDFTSYTDANAMSPGEQTSVKLYFDAVDLWNTTNTAYLLPRYFNSTGNTCAFGNIKYNKVADSYEHNISPAAPNKDAFVYGSEFEMTEDVPFVQPDGNGKIASKYITPSCHKVLDASYSDVTYVMFRTYMKAGEISTFVDATNDGTNPLVYSYKGELIGSKSKLKDSNNARLNAMYTNAVAETKKVGGTYENKSVDDALIGLYKSELRQYKYHDGKYYVYYQHPITRTKVLDKKTNHCLWYGVNANEIYDISINSIKKMGFPEGEKPGKIYTEDEPDDYIQLNVKVKAWTKRNNAYDLE